MRDMFIIMKYGRKIRYIFWSAFCLVKYFTYHLVLVPVLASNYKQHIFSPAKFKKVYSLAEFYVKSVYLNLFGLRWA
jgi:hypothetical protein